MMVRELEAWQVFACAGHSVGETDLCFPHTTWQSCAAHLWQILRVRYITFVEFLWSSRQGDVRKS